MATLSDLSMLVVEDNPNTRQMIVRILQAFGVSLIHQAEEGSRAVSVLQSQRIDVLLTDWNMAPLDGMAVAEWVRTSPQSPDPYLPIVMISSLNEDGRPIQAYNAGINQFLAKPVQPRDIWGTLHDLVRNPRPFIRTPTYFGPDRRRGGPCAYDGEDRRRIDAVPHVPHTTSQRSRAKL
jgi:CheY-like chemotaxis protein